VSREIFDYSIHGCPQLSLILGEMDVIKGTYNELGKTKPLNVIEANSINASQVKPSIMIIILIVTFPNIGEFDDQIRFIKTRNATML